jgi:hypothetical protein
MSWTMHGLRKKETSNKFITHPAMAGGGASPYHIKQHLSSTLFKHYYEGSKNFPDSWPNKITKAINFSRFLDKPYITQTIVCQTIYQ